MQRNALLLSSLLVALTFAGCLSDAPSDGDGDGIEANMVQVQDMDPFFDGAWYDSAQFTLDDVSAAVFDILPVEEVWVEASDGTMLHSGVYRPDTDDPTPVFINFSPYHGDTAEARGDGFGQYMIDNYVPRGYTVVLSSIRGTGHSEGCFEVASDREAQDLSEVVDFFAEQVWSNGFVAAGGKSYDSTTQNGAIAKFPTSNLKAIFHVSGITDMYEYTYHNGLPARADAAAFTTYYSLGQGTDEYAAVPTSSGAADTDDDGPESFARLVGDLSCEENAETVLFPVAAMADGSKSAYWQERDWASVVADTEWDGSIFFYHGFQDWNVQPSHILPWLANLPDQIDTKVWLHQDTENGGHLYPMRADWNLTMLRWLDTELKGMDTGFWDEPRAELQGSDGRWRAFDHWPLDEPQVAIDHDTVTDSVHVDGGTGAPAYHGAPRVQVSVTPISPDPVFSAVLYDRDPNGVLEWRNEATLRVLYREGLDAPSTVTPGTPVDIDVAFYPQSDVLPPGHSWVIAFQEAPVHTVVTEAQLAGLTVDEGRAAFTFPLGSADDGVLEHQPVPTDCFAC